MSLHGITIHIGGSCLQVSPLGPGFSRKRCHRHLSLCSEGFSSPPVAPLLVRKREARCGGAARAVAGNPLSAILLAALNLQPECPACGEEKCSAAGRAKKARPVKPKVIGPELGRGAYFGAWEEHKVKQ